jgi:PhnB protein
LKESRGGRMPMGFELWPIEKTFWPLRFGIVTDRFGIDWVINCEKSE